MNNTKQQEAFSFDGLGIAPKILKIITDLGYITPTPIQTQSIPSSLERKDMVGIAQTGTGKTLAFGIPMIQLLATHKGMGLIIQPTRELAIQVDEHLEEIGKQIGLRTSVLIGGEPISKQLKSLRKKPHIIIATPGRLLDHTQRGSADLSNVRILVLDEADLMLDMGFLPDIKKTLKLLPKQRQTMLFSATMPSPIVRIASEYMIRPTRIEVAPSGTAAENVEQEIIVIGKQTKFDHIKKILSETRGTVLIFMRTKHAVKNMTSKIKQNGFSAAEIHSNRSLGQRQEALSGFKSGKYRILVATDIASRGIDVRGIELVINHDLPEKAGDYVHRIGRTARAGQNGRAISLITPGQIKNVDAIERLIRKRVKINKTAAELKAIRDIENYTKRGSAYSSSSRKGRRSRRPYSRPAFQQTVGVSNTFISRHRGDAKSTTTPTGKFRTSKNQNISKNPRQGKLTDKERFRRSMKSTRW